MSSSISTYIEKIKSSIYGEDMRMYIWMAIQEIYNSVIAQGNATDGVTAGFDVFTETSNNLFDPVGLELGLLDSDGTVKTNTSYVTTSYIPVTPSTKYFFTSAIRVVGYNSSKTKVSYNTTSSGTISLTTSSSAYYIRVSVPVLSILTAKINELTNEEYVPGRSAIDYNLRADVYRKTEIDTRFSNVYTKTQVYTKTEIDNLIGPFTLTTAQETALIGLLD